jgi:hypothetical protein
VLQKEFFDVMDQDFVPFGYIDDGLEPEGEKAGDDWWVAERERFYPFDDYGYDFLNKHRL